MVHVQLDLETYGTSPGSIIRSIGAITFDLDDETRGGETYYANILHSSCEAAGLTYDQSTVDWWANQSAQAKAHLETPEPRPLATVVEEFHRWFRREVGKYVWCQGASFDVVLWEVAARAVKQGVPWRYYHVRDTRTAYDLAGLDPRTVVREGTHHSALDDARHQVRCLRAAYARLAVRPKAQQELALEPGVAEATAPPATPRPATVCEHGTPPGSPCCAASENWPG